MKRVLLSLLLTVRLFDAYGRLVRSQAVEGSGARFTLPTDDLPTGAYLLEVNNGRERMTGRFLKQ